MASRRSLHDACLPRVQLTLASHNPVFSRSGSWFRRKEVTLAKIFIVVPEAPIEEAAQLEAKRTLGSGGIRLGLLDNSKANADHLLNFMVEGVKKGFDVASVVYKRKPASSAPATEQILDELAKEADLVVSAMAD